MRGLRIYKLGIGSEGLVLKTKEAKAMNIDEARKMALDWLHQECRDTGISYDYAEAKPIPKSRPRTIDTL